MLCNAEVTLMHTKTICIESSSQKVYGCTFSKQMRGVSPAVRKAIVALRVYATELEDERIKLDEEVSYYRSIMGVVKKKEEKAKPIAREMLKPMFEINDQMQLNLTEIREIRKKNRVLRQQIQDIETQLAIEGTDCTEVEAQNGHIDDLIQQYRILLNEWATPPELPYPYNADWELNWSIINAETVELDEPYREACRQIANIRGPFDSLPMDEKKHMIYLLRALKGHIYEVFDEIKRIELSDMEPLRQRVLIRACIKKYAALAMSMRKVQFM